MRVGLGLRQSKLQELISYFSFAFPGTSGDRQCLVNNFSVDYDLQNKQLGKPQSLPLLEILGK